MFWTIRKLHTFGDHDLAPAAYRLVDSKLFVDLAIVGHTTAVSAG
jgi:hypothetical protein